LTWSFNLGFKTTSKSKAASFAVEAARHRRSNVAESIDRETELALEKLKLTHRRYVTALNEYKISSDNYRLARARHQSGALSANRLLEIEAALTHAESSLAAAKVDYYIAQSGYYYAAGSDKLGKGI
jgi:outer membrane protein TolC